MFAAERMSDDIVVCGCSHMVIDGSVGERVSNEDPSEWEHLTALGRSTISLGNASPK